MAETETGWTNNQLRQAIDEMNEQPDISANDTSRLKELCRVTAMEIKAVGSVSAATSLEMIGYIRELESSQVDKDDHVAWCRYKYNSEGGIQSIVTCDSDAKGAFKVYRAAPSDFEQLTRLREAAKVAVTVLDLTVADEPKAANGLAFHQYEDFARQVTSLRDAANKLREALAQRHQETKKS